jgi:hypothetical protein
MSRVWLRVTAPFVIRDKRPRRLGHRPGGRIQADAHM